MEKNYRQFFSLFVLFVIVIAQFASTQPARAAATIYVAPAGLTSGACTSWGTACDLQYALSIALSGDALWVMQGTYKPSTTADRTATFTLVNEVAVYGGFLGTETALGQRNSNPATNGTILSGDVDGIAGNAGNSYHVVTGPSLSALAVLDGFTITAGNANGGDNFGGGLHVDNSSLTLSNIAVSNNSAGSGGGMAMFGASTATLSNVVFTGNTASIHGGGLYIQDCTPILNTVTFSSNSAATYGGGMYAQNSIPNITNANFNGNSSTTEGGGLFINNSPAIITNSVFTGNSVVGGPGGGLFNNFSNSVVTNVTFTGNTVTGGGAGVYNYFSTPTFSNITFDSNTAGRRGGGMVNEGSNPTLTNVTFNGNAATQTVGAAPWGGGGIFNLNSNPTLNNTTFGNNVSTTADGMSNAGTSTPVIFNSIFWDNSTNEFNNIDTSSITISDSVVKGGYAGTNIISLDPLLNPLASNGGFTQTMAITVHSSAIDKGGVNSACAGTDQRGLSRPRGAGCDIGAYERDTSVLASPLIALTSWNNTFSWTGFNTASWYYLELYTSTDTLVFRKWYTVAEANCVGSTACSISPAETVGLSNGSYKWRILDYGDFGYGYGGWTAKANFSLSAACYTLATNVLPVGSGAVSATPQNCAGGYIAGTAVQLTATSNEGYLFNNWSGDAAGASNPISFTMDGNKSVTANFSGVTLIAPTGNLSSWNNTFSWTGFNNSSWYLLDVYTTTDTLVFRKWYMAAQTNCSGGTACSVSPIETAGLANGNYKWRIMDYGDGYGFGRWTAFKNFNLNAACYTLTPNTLPANSGAFNASVQNCGGGYISGTVVQLTITPNAGYVFLNWSGDASGTSNSISITMDGNKNVNANLRGVTLIAPSGTLGSWNNTFSWTGLSDASWYLLQVLDTNDATVHLKWYTVAQTGCSGGTACSVSPVETLNLAGGSYKWRILDYGDGYSFGMWTGYKSFSIP